MRRRLRSAASVVLTVLAVALVWFGLTAPDRAAGLGPAAFLRVPLEAVVFAAVALLLPPRARVWAALLVGAVLGAVVLLRLLDMAFFETLDRPFDTVVDWGYLGPLVGLVVDSVGRSAGVGVISLVALLVVLLLVMTPLAVLRLTRLLARHPRASWRGVGVLGVVWLLSAVLGLSWTAGPLASTGAATYAADEVTRIPAQLHDQHAFVRATADDPLHRVPGNQLLTALHGKDVLFVFVESYGRVAVQGSDFSPRVDAVLDQGTRRLRAAGFSSRSAFLTSPTFGGISWLAHSTLQSGLWVDSQQRYSVLTGSHRDTLTRAFGRAGWRTVSDIPADTAPWRQGTFYGYDHFYDSRNVGYAGPRFGYPTMPDQYTLAAFRRLELAPRHRRPVMGEIDLVSSHAPWSRTPHLVPDRSVGDGSVFDGMPQRSPSKTVVWRSPASVRAAYGQSIEYSLRALVDFIRHSADPHLVVVFLGDHQPATVVSGDRAGHDVPITLTARDPAVLHRIRGWGWQPGLRPHLDAPVWRMDTFRDRFLDAFGAAPSGPDRAH